MPAHAMFDLTGRRVLVSGGSSGIGRAIAQGFLEAGAKVAVMSRDAAAGEAAVAELAAHGPALFTRGDVAVAADCAAAVAATVTAFGGLEVVVAAAGLNKRRRPEELSEADWDLIVGANLKGTFLLVRAAYPALRAAGGGRVVTIGSMMSLLANGVTPASAAAQGGVVPFTRSCAVARAAAGITANCILPGWIDTPLTRGARADIPTLQRMVEERTPMARWGRPADVVGTCLFLATPAAAFVTGTAIPVDGGYAIRG